MVTLLEAGLFEHFTIIFSLLFVIAVVFGILEMVKIFGSNRGLNILIAFLFGLIVLLVPDVSKLITTMVPWFTLLFIFIILVLIAFKIFGATDTDIASAMKDKAVMWTILIISIIIIVSAFGGVYGQKFLTLSQQEPAAIGEGAGSTTTGSFSTNLGATFFHPKVLGFILIMIIATFTIAILSARYE